MIINNKIFNLPPYISTTWANVQGLHMKEFTLIVTLSSGDAVHISGLSNELIEKIFLAHRAYLESPESQSRTGSIPATHLNHPVNFESIGTFQFGSSGIEGLGAAMQHNPAHANAPNMPPEFLEKISAISKIMAPDDLSHLPQAEPHCNCPHCQIARAITGDFKAEPDHPQIEEGEPVSPEELAFQQWEIVQTGNQLYEVTNKLATHEKYHVFLGDPIGCTCGEKGCVHIPIVLKSYA